MHWAYPHNIWWLWLIPAVIILWLVAFKKRSQLLKQFAGTKLLRELTQSIQPSVRLWKSILITFGIIFMIVALIGPQWGFYWQEVKRQGIDLIIALDVSKSMLAEDIKPNRLERAKLAIQDLVPRLKGDRIGLIAFAGSGFVLCPLTVDYGAFLLALDDLSVDTIPFGGTALEQSIRESLRSFKVSSSKSKALIIISDGESLQGNSLAAAKEAAENGVVIFTIGIGTTEGELIPIKDQFGSSTFLKDREGKTVKSRLDEVALQQVALATNGSYIKATATDFGIERIYNERIRQMEPQEFESSMKKQHDHRYQWPLAVAFILLAIEPLISNRKRFIT